MALIIPSGPAFAHWTTNFGSTVAANTPSGFGTPITIGASNSDGTAVTLISALSHDCEYLWLGFCGFTLLSTAPTALLDILIDPAGGTSWTSLIDDLIVSGAGVFSFSGSSVFGMPLAYHFPIWLKAGTSIGARVRSAAATTPTTGTVFAMAAGGNKNPASWWCGQKVETIGTFDAANSLGQLHMPGVSGSYSSWTDLGSPSTGRAGAVQWGVGCGNTADIGSRSYRYEFGAASTMIGPPVIKILSSSEAGWSVISNPIFCDLPSGTQLQVRGETSASSIDGGGSSGGRSLDCGAYLVQ
jgi:hypothetical protein